MEGVGHSVAIWQQRLGGVPQSHGQEPDFAARLFGGLLERLFEEVYEPGLARPTDAVQQAASVLEDFLREVGLWVLAAVLLFQDPPLGALDVEIEAAGS